jgi:alpha-methylacyl-CoA racemase
VSGPLEGLKIIELAGIGPGPFAAMALSDAGADVLRIDRPEKSDSQADGPLAASRSKNVMNRGRRSITLDLKNPEAVEFVLQIAEHADGLIEGFRPGVTERLGIGPDDIAARNRRLVYGRVTGWGREGPYALTAGHDINYIALSGTLGAIGPADGKPVPPLNLLGDFGGGGLLLAYGMTCALYEASQSGQGQVVDVAMVDGAAYLATYIYGMRALDVWGDERESNVLDGGAPFYQVYKTSDGKFLAVGSIEEQFFLEMLRLVGLDDEHGLLPGDRSQWQRLHELLTVRFASRTREQWERVFEGTDACVAPVLSMQEAPDHKHLREWGTFTNYDGTIQPSPTPRFSRTPSSIKRPPPRPGQGGMDALEDWGFERDAIGALVADGVFDAETAEA